MQKQTLRRNGERKRVIPLSADRQLALSRPLIMGILNVTPDSFSDGGQFDTTDKGVAHVLKMIDDGADIIDIGGESSRPGAEPVTPDEELSRVMPIIQRIRQRSDIPISIDTCKASVAEAALNEGADIVNDISALRFDEAMADVIVRTKAPVILMHMLGTPEKMQENPSYENCVGEIKQFFGEQTATAISAGIDRVKIIIDPGIGFGKRLADNIEILSNVAEFGLLGFPVLIGASRKSCIGMLNPASETASDRLGGSIAAAVMAVINGADIVRVHDVGPTMEALKVIQATRKIY